MAVTAKPYGSLPAKAFNKEADLDTDTIKLTLHTSTYAPAQDTHDYFNDVTNELPTANGYTAGGVTLTNKAVTYDAATNTMKFDADDISWPGATFTARYAVLRVDTGTSSTSALIGYVDFGEDLTGDGNFVISWDSTNGVLTVTVNA